MSEREFVQGVGRMALRYDKYSGCSQSVLLSLQEGFKIGDDESFKAATVLSGGVVRSGETCGALIGGLMALGLVIGRDRMEDTAKYVHAIEVGQRICEEFKKALKEEYGFQGNLKSTLCRKIQEKVYGRYFNLNDKGEYQAFLNAGGHSDQGCPRVCMVASKVVAEEIIRLGVPESP